MISRLIRKLQHRLSCIAGWTENMEEKKYKAIIEGILFSMGESVELEKIAGTLGLDQKKTKDLIDEMRNEWEEQKRGVTITELDGAYNLYNMIEEVAPELIAEKRHIFKGVSPNVDFYSGFVYEMLGIPSELYTPLFAIARIAGWSAHRLEELVGCNKIIRPAYKSVMEELE